MNRKGFSHHAVFVVGAGASADLGYPLTRDLLSGLERCLGARLQHDFKEIVEFHHPVSYGSMRILPDIEELLTEILANEDLLPTLRPNGP